MRSSILRSRILSFSILLLSILHNSTAQKSWFQDVTPHSPNVSALGKFGDIPVGNYTGTPNINIPIYTLESGSLNMSVSLKYHASGIRVNDMSSWVGLGWALEAGGYVSRRVRGVADEGPKNSINGMSNGYYQDYGPNMVLRRGPEYDFVIEGIKNGVHDVEPDLFFFSFGSFSGSFYFDQYRRPHLVPEQDLKIEVNYTDGTPGKFNQFVITTPNGVKYYFGGTGTNGIEAVEYTYPNAGVNFTNKGYISNWYLNKIENTDKSDSIYFEYKSESYKFFNLAQFSQIIKEGSCAGVSTPNQSYTEDQIDGVRLSRITSCNVIIEFEADSTASRKDIHGGNSYILSNISIKNKTQTELLTCFKLSYHWENCSGIQIEAGQSSNLSEDKWRLFLDQIQDSTTNFKNPPYKFAYYQLPSSSDISDGPKLPRRLSYDQDHWGYFNNAGNTKQNWLLPPLIFPTFDCPTINSLGGANRETSWPAMRAGTIKSIQYPTGGRTSFDYESHNYYTHWTEPEITKTFPVSVGNGSSTGTNSSPSIDYTFPIAEAGETLKVELVVNVTVPSTSSNCAEIHLYDDNNGGAEITGSSFDCSLGQYPSKKIPVTLISGRAYKLRLVAANCMGQVIVTKTKIVSKEGYKNVGGLRIIKTTDTPGNNSREIIRTYSYSNAALFSVPVYQRELISQTEDYLFDNLVCFADEGKKLYEISSTSVVPMLTSQGNHMGYGSVTIKQPGQGKIVYTYTNDLPSAFLALQFMQYPTPPPPNLFENGSVRNEKYYDEKDSLVKEVEYTYDTNYNSGITVPSINFVSVSVPPVCISYPGTSVFNNGYQHPLWIEYPLNTGYSRLKTKTVTDHFSSGNLISKTEFKYSTKYIQQIGEEIQTRSDKKVVKILTSYPKDNLPEYSYSPSCYEDIETSKHVCLREFNTSVQDCLNQTVELVNSFSCQQVLAQLIAEEPTYVISNTASCAQSCDWCKNRLIEALSRNCRNNDAYRNRYLNCLGELESEGKTCLTEYNNNYNTLIISDKESSDLTTQMFYDMWNLNKIMPIEETTWVKENENTTDFSFISGNYLEYGKFAVGLEDIKLKSVYEIPTNSKLTDFTTARVNNKVFTKDNRYELKVSAQYTNGRQSEVWKEGDIHTSYCYGYDNSYPVVKAENLPYSELQSKITASLPSGYTTLEDLIKSITSLPNNSWSTFNENLRKEITTKTLITTYTYNPLYGLTSQTDPNGVTTYYEYDSLGRLKYIKDDDGHILKTFDYHYSGQTK